jgi:hypothetical protein
VVDISSLHREIADLAYLSACSTARVGAALTDEAIHLASTFQLAGYRHVVATLWPINDRRAVCASRRRCTTAWSRTAQPSRRERSTTRPGDFVAGGAIFLSCGRPIHTVA